jgi:hypothetical protein
MRNNDFYSPLGAAFGGLGSNPVGTNGNISANPLFINSALTNYHLSSASPAIDVGSNPDAPATDFDGSPRPYAGNTNNTPIADMGAYEWSPIRGALLPFTLNNSGQPTLVWSSVGGTRYRVEYSDGDGQGGLSGTFSGIIRTATDETDSHPNGVISSMSFTDTNPPPAGPSRYYRVKTLNQL